VRELRLEPGLQGRHNRCSVLAPGGEARLRRLAAHGLLDGVERTDVTEHGLGDRRGRAAHHLHEAPADMAPAMHERPATFRPREVGEPVVGVVAVALQEAATEPFEEGFGMGAAAGGRVSEQRHGRIEPAMAAIIRRDGPKPAGFRLLASGIEHRGPGLVHEQPVRAAEMGAHSLDDGFEVEARPARPIAQRGAVEIKALPTVDLGLAVERQVVAELGNDDVGDQRLGGQAARHEAFRGVSLRDRTPAAAAGVSRPTRHQHPGLRRHDVETL
jgi:hypothetical protein